MDGPATRPRRSQRTGIPNLKVGFNKVFGYYLEVTHAHRDKMPADYIRKQTLKNAERYITPELKEYEEKVLSAEEQAKELEYELFVELRDAVAAQARRLQATAAVLAQLDVLAGLAELARAARLRAGRRSSPSRCWRSTTAAIRCSTSPSRRARSCPTTRPAAATTARSCSSPAQHGRQEHVHPPGRRCSRSWRRWAASCRRRRATIGVADRIFARVGASDELSRGQSTFMVEMTETARILNTATPRSLVILDEIGRGTSTYDGLSLAWAIVEHLHDRIGCRTLFATHYHELTDLAETLAGVRNFNVAVRSGRTRSCSCTRSCPARPTRATASTSPAWPACRAR